MGEASGVQVYPSVTKLREMYKYNPSANELIQVNPNTGIGRKLDPIPDRLCYQGSMYQTLNVLWIIANKKQIPNGYSVRLVDGDLQNIRAENIVLERNDVGRRRDIVALESAKLKIGEPPSIEALHAIFNYDPERGQIFTHKAKGLSAIGGRIGRANQSTGIGAMVLGYRTTIQRIVWAMETGKWPAHNERVVHKDKNPFNNKITNLELVPVPESTKPIRPNKDGTAWIAELEIAGTKIHLGEFPDFATASKALNTKRNEIGEELEAKYRPQSFPNPLTPPSFSVPMAPKEPRHGDARKSQEPNCLAARGTSGGSDGPCRVEGAGVTCDHSPSNPSQESGRLWSR